ncbi:hypothetical protein [Shinella sp. M31]|uniref:hypothetical protein n=1 Tax=Shinella sp. M31 TaxID=3368615 RepID=UPI003BA1123A
MQPERGAVNPSPANGIIPCRRRDEAIARAIEAITKAPTPDCEIYAIRLGGAVCDVDDAATAYSGRKADYYWIAELVWDDPYDDSRCLAWVREAAAHLASKAIAGNYVNEQGDDDPSWPNWPMAPESTNAWRD